MGAWLVVDGSGVRCQVEPVVGWPQTTGWVAGFHTGSYGKQVTYTAVIAFRAAGPVGSGWLSFAGGRRRAVEVFSAQRDGRHVPGR
jgi:hypothetical protein